MPEPASRIGRPRVGDRGFALAEVLVALALAGFAAAATATLLHASVRAAREASRDAQLLDAARNALARLDADAFHVLPERFGAGDDATVAVLDTANGTAPRDWSRAVEDLPGGRVRARLEGLGRDGVSAPFRQALALRITVDATCACGPRGSRGVRLVRLRF